MSASPVPTLPLVLAEERPPSAEVATLFRIAGLNGPLDQLPRLQRMIDEAQQVITARRNGELVGLIRVLTDFAYNAFIADLAVHPSVQRTGLGSRLVDEATRRWSDVKFVVHPGHDSGAFWACNGFSAAPTCMVRGRRT